MSGGASLRMWRFCKSLQDSLKIEVLTVENPKKYYIVDYSLIVGIENIVTHRVGMWRLNKIRAIMSVVKINPLFLIPEGSYGWLGPSVRKGKEVVKKSSCDYILGVYPILTSLLSSYKISKSTKIPLIIDLHDLFYDIFKHQPPTFFQKKRYLKLERKILNHAFLISVVTEEFKNILVRRHKLDQDKIVVIPNNADLNEYNAIPIMQRKEFVISYFGIVAPYHFEGVILLVKALNKFKKNNKKYNIKFRIASRLTPKIKKKLLELDENNLIENIGFVKKVKANKLMKNSDVLYLTLSPTHKYALEMKSTNPSKLFEYLCCGKPILAYLPKGSTQKFITNNDLGFVLTEYSVNQLANLITELYNNKNLREKFSKNCLEVAKKYDSKVVYRHFLEFLN